VQTVEFSAAESRLQGDLAEVRRVRETAKQARTSLAQVTRDNQDDTGESLEEASTHMGELSEATNAMRKADS
jgi:hypothetical protein